MPYKVSQAQRRKIWAAAKQKGLSEDDVRNIIFAITGQGSTSDISMDEARRIIDRITGKEYKTDNTYVDYNKKANAQKRANQITDRQKWKINQLILELGWEDDQKRIEGFIRKYANVDKVNWLTKQQAVKIIDGLKTMLARQQQEVC